MTRHCLLLLLLLSVGAAADGNQLKADLQYYGEEVNKVWALYNAGLGRIKEMVDKLFHVDAIAELSQGLDGQLWEGRAIGRAEIEASIVKIHRDAMSRKVMHLRRYGSTVIVQGIFMVEDGRQQYPYNFEETWLEVPEKKIREYKLWPDYL